MRAQWMRNDDKEVKQDARESVSAHCHPSGGVLFIRCPFFVSQIFI